MQKFRISENTIENVLKNKNIPEPFILYIELIMFAISDIYDDNVLRILDDVEFHFSNDSGKYSETKFNIADDSFKIKYKITLNSIDKLTKYQIMEYLSHELNKIYCTSKQPYLNYNEEALFHSGFYVNKLNTKKSYGKTLNEVYNSFQTEIILKTILNYTEEDLSDKLYKAIVDLKKELPKRIVSPRFSNEVALFRRLLENKQIKNIIDSNIRDGNILVIEEIFNSFLGDISYVDLNNKLDILSKKLHKSKGLKVNEISILNCEIRNILDNLSKKYQAN